MAGCIARPIRSSIVAVRQIPSSISRVDCSMWKSGECSTKPRLASTGHAGWQAGQLESEIQANGWLHCPADPELIFNTALETRWRG
jgi:putative AlgH/UPF0301 family transcriptional regulator